MTGKAKTPWDLFNQSFHKYGDKSMVVHNNREVTYGKMHQMIESFCQRIENLDFRVGGIYLPNCIEYISYILALNKLKRVVVPLSSQLKGDSLFERINYSDIELIITNEKGFLEIYNIKDKISIRNIIVLKNNGELEVHTLNSHNKKLEGILENTFAICFTSGSTSKPKAVLIPNEAITGNAYAIADFFGFHSSDRFLMVRPFSQAGPIVGDILMPISQGGSMVILNDLFHPAIFLKTIQEYKVTSTLLVTTMVSLIIDYPGFSNFDISSLNKIIFGGMTIPPSIVRNAIQKMPGVNFFNTYGLTETCTKVSYICLPEITQFPDSIGKPIKGCDMKIYREDGSEADIGEEGEIYVITDYIMDGYYKTEELTMETLTPKGMRTRDMGYRDENGWFYIVGRNDDLIIQGGNNVYPIEIEEILVRHESIKEAVVLGIDDDKLGKKIVAFVSPKSGFTASMSDLFRWCRANLEDKKVPKEIHIVDVIPRNDVDKVSRNEMRKVYYENTMY